MNRAKLFIDNFLTYGFMTILSRIIPLLLLPVITWLLPNATDFGQFDLFTIITFFGTCLAELGLFNAMFKEFTDRDTLQGKYNVISTALHMLLISSIVIALGLLAAYLFLKDLFFEGIQYKVILLSSIGIFFSVMFDLTRHPTRMLNDRKVFVISSLWSAFLQKAIAIALILLGFAYYGLIFAIIATNIIIIIYLFIKNKDFFLKGHFEKETAKTLLKLGLPLLPVALVFWVYSYIDRIMILNLAQGDPMKELGVYALGAKVAGITNFLYMAFAVGWGNFSFTTMRDKDYKEVMSTVFSIIFAVITSLYLILFLFKDIIFTTLFSGDYARGIEVYPLLLISPLLLILLYIIENPLYYIKKTIYSPFMYGAGCIVNIALNYLLIPKYGIWGAAVATVAGYLSCILFYMVLIVYIKKLMLINKRLIGLILLFLFIFVCINIPGAKVWHTLLPISGYLMLVFLLYRKEAWKYYRKWRKG